MLELLVLLPDADETNKTFYADVWQPQEIRHGLILDRLQQDLGRTAAEPQLQVSFGIKILGALAHLKPIQDIAKLMYFLTGASTERQAVLAYNKINRGMQQLGETAHADAPGADEVDVLDPAVHAFYPPASLVMSAVHSSRIRSATSLPVTASSLINRRPPSRNIDRPATQ